MGRRERVVLIFFGLFVAELGTCAFWLFVTRTPKPRVVGSPSVDDESVSSSVSVRTDTEPRFDGLGDYRRAIRTSSKAAAEFFDQGLAFFYGFNTQEASRSFEAAADADPECAMAYWGIALSNGPHLNTPVVSGEQAAKAFDAITKAQRLTTDPGCAEFALIDALRTRITESPISDVSRIDLAYAAAMKNVLRGFPTDPDVGALTADALLNMHRWQFWTRDGHAHKETLEAIFVLQAVLKCYPRHPYALHLLIHSVDGSPHPDIGAVAADRLRDFAPGLEHLLHMPSHIDVRFGRWQAAFLCNERAIAAAHHYGSITDVPPIDTLGMAVHNHCMLAYCAMMQGRCRKATDIVREMCSEIFAEVGPEYSVSVDPYLFIPYEVHLRFGEWQQMLSEPRPAAHLRAATAFWHYSRAVALAATKNIQQATLERDQFLLSRLTVPTESKLHVNFTSRLLEICTEMLEGELAYREGKPSEAVAALRKAVELEDDLIYSEPPDWMMPVRHALGATLLAAGRDREAEAVYRDDLQRHPANGWALHGLMQSLRMQGKTAAALAVEASFEESWKYADTEITSSCCCLSAEPTITRSGMARKRSAR
jgi:tetratricopeptide (TPR) repeat protein